MVLIVIELVYGQDCGANVSYGVFDSDEWCNKVFWRLR